MKTHSYVSPSLNQEHSPLNVQIKEQHALEGEARRFFLFISHGQLNCMLTVHRFKTLRIGQPGSVVVVGITHIFFYNFSSGEVSVNLRALHRLSWQTCYWTVPMKRKQTKHFYDEVRFIYGVPGGKRLCMYTHHICVCMYVQHLKQVNHFYVYIYFKAYCWIYLIYIHVI